MVRKNIINNLIMCCKTSTSRKQKISHVAKELGIIPTTLSCWIYEYETNGEQVFSGNGNMIHNKEFDIFRLQKKNKELEMEREILKKFQAFLKQKSK